MSNDYLCDNSNGNSNNRIRRLDSDRRKEEEEMKTKRSKACDITQAVKQAVWERDGERCIICGSPYAMPNAHYISRAHGGLGIEQNIVTLCQTCHHTYDNTSQRPFYREAIKAYLRGKYGAEWDEEKLVYNKFTQK